MKKFMFLLILLLFPVMVYAEDYSVKTLIPVDTKVSVKTEKFDYNGFVYNSKVDDKGNSLITFDSIKNNKVVGSFVSVNILLFDESQKNIGLVAYCTDKDLDSNYSDFELAGKSNAPFSIKVVSKYFVEGKGSADVKYISVLDENKYCQIGGYDKYKGLTIDEIANGVGNKKEVSGISKLINDIQEKNLGPVIIIGLVSLAILVILIMVISSIIKKIKSNRVNKMQEVKLDVPVEETVDLTYGEVNTDNETLDDDSSISMGEVTTTPVENTLEEDTKEEKSNDEEDGSDLTKFFN